MPTPPPAWSHLPFFSTDWPRIAAALTDDPRTILPPEPQIFAALALTPPADTRVVILGQDPYPTPGHAMGLAFSVAPGTPLPRSLRNIYTEMQADLGACPTSGDLTHWARQGVLLLNTCLTVPAGEANGHKSLGWAALARQVIAETASRPCAYLLWGRPAQGFAPTADTGHLIIETAHPSPLSARRGFFGSRPFSRVNDWLTARGDTPIDWAGHVNG